MARKPIQVLLSSIYASEWHHLRLCFLLCPTSGGLLPLDSDKKLRLLQCAFHAKDWLGCPQEQEAGLHQVYKCVAWLLLSLTANCGRIWSDAGFCCMEDTLPSFSFHSGASQRQFPADTDKWVSHCTMCVFVVLSPYHWESEAPWGLKKMTVDVRRLYRNGQWAHGTSPLYPKRQDSGVLKCAVRKWTSTGVDGLHAAYFSNWGLEHHTQIITPKAGWFSATGCLMLSTDWIINRLLLSTKSILEGAKFH